MTEAEKAAVRQWAWAEMKGWGATTADGHKPWQFHERLLKADYLAAFVMSGVEAPAEFCSFCSKAPFEVHKMIAGARAWICDECVADVAKTLSAKAA